MITWKTFLYMLPSTFKLGRQKIETAHLPHDTESLKFLYDAIKKWCILNKFLIPTNDNTAYVPNIATTDLSGKLCIFIYELNFKRLCVNEYLNDALLLFQDTEFDRTTSRLYDLHLRLLTEIDSRFLNIYINNLHYGLSTLYSNNTSDEEVTSWESIFQTYRYIWILFPLQQIMRDHTPLD